jgi:phage terminase Nu1 subunit (DNA packaging protein)
MANLDESKSGKAIKTKMTMKEYASHRAGLGLNGSLAMISRHVKNGKIPHTVDGNGHKLISPEDADEAWKKNVSLSHVRNLKQEKFKREGTEFESNEETESEDVPDGMTFAQASAVEKNYKAKLAKIEYEKEIGKLVPALEVESEWCKIISSLKTKILAVPSSIRQQDPTVTLSQINMIESAVRNALTEFAEDKDI